MHTDYSKPSADVAPETMDWQIRDKETLNRQGAITRHLESCPLREKCLLCGGNLSGGDSIRHRGIAYVRCRVCSHVQCRNKPTPGYPASIRGQGFETIYPHLAPAAYRQRRDRIYTPKLDWALSRINKAHLTRETALSSRWLELGCGAGYFLSALQSQGATRITGLDSNQKLVDLANEACGREVARLAPGSLVTAVREADADIIAAFFVLEHVSDAQALWEALATRPVGTVFIFSVPVYGFATLLEGAFDGFSARNLDSVLHTQLYTDASIRYALDASGYQLAAEWIFGQDATDLCRVLASRITAQVGAEVAAEITAALAQLTDPMQAVIDRARLADARHLLAVKC